MLRDEGHPIKVVARRVGLSPHVIRMWEKRYQAVVPKRTLTKRRMYSDAEVERLVLLRRAINAGRSIGQIAHLPTKRLLALVAADEATGTLPQLIVSTQTEEIRAREQQPVDTPGEQEFHQKLEIHLRECLAAVERFDPDALEAALAHVAVTLGQAAFIEDIIVPFMHKIGDLWRDGELRVAHEHLASAVVRMFLGDRRGSFETPPVAPNIVVATPTGQIHELGALVVAAIAVSEGWRVIYLGASLSAEEIAGAARQSQARAVALSVVYPNDDPRLQHEFEQLHRYLPEGVALLVGGRASEGYKEVLQAIGAVRLNDLRGLRLQLEALRSSPSAQPS